MKNSNKIMKIISPIFLVLILIGLVYGFGVSSPYWKDNPLTMAAGETKTINFNLQNMVGDEDVNVKVELKEGSEIASLGKDTYTVKTGTSDTFVPLEIKIPRKDAEDTYNIVIEVKTITSGGEGTVTLGTGMTTSFDVLISGEVEADYTNFILIGVSILAIIIFVIILLKKFKKKKKSK